ncbi:DUF6505 family protein [Halodurantibacterium flavum]|uniref:DUF6505 family protein n=1 Tax=Halodurantibacterium flavum TaxID=1382802 RepID=A0ABW4S9Q3_9RHOB
MILLPRTIQLDPSDTVIFAPAAAPGEWAVPGTFLYHGRPAGNLNRKEQIAFRSGFLGVESFGHSTLVTVTPARPEERAAVVEALAAQFVAKLGAPDIATARPAAEEEIAFAEDICRGHPQGTLIALHRAREGDDIREQFRTIRPRDETAFSAGYLRGHDRAFHIIETDEDDPGIDLLDLRGKE